MTTQTSAETEVAPNRRGPARPLIGLGVVAALLVGVLAVKAAGSDPAGVDVRDGTTLVSVEGLAAHYGISVTLVATSAAGGVVDFRYQVVDPDKANPIIHDVDLLPKLVVEETGQTLVLSSLPHHHGTELELGGTYFFLLANSSGAVEKGSLITLVIGDVRLEHIVAQG